MRHILALLLMFISFTALSQQQIDSSGGLAPLGAYPVTSTQYVKGANRSVTTIADRNNIPAYLRDTGMIVYVTQIDSSYILKGGLANDNWTAYKTGGGGTSRTIIDTIQTTGQALTIAAYSGGGRVISLSTLGANGSNFLPTYATAGDTTYIAYEYAPNGQVIYKLTVIDIADSISGGGIEVNPGGGGGEPVNLTFSQVTNALGFVPIASPVSYTSLTNRPSLSSVATSGNYTDLSNRPTLAPVATLGTYTSLTGRPTFSTVATSGSYADLLNRPTFSSVATSGSYTDLANRPSFSTVATSGAYADLTGKPAIPAQLNLVAVQGVKVSGTYPNLTASVDTTYLNNYLASHVVTTGGNLSIDCYNQNTKYGILVAPFDGDNTPQWRLTQQTADSLGLDVIRVGMNSQSGGNYVGLTTLLNSGREVQVNIRNTPGDGTRNFTSNAERAAYVTYLDTFFRNTLAPASGDTLIICDNEEANKGYHILDTSSNLANQSAYRYFMNELKPLDSIAKLYGNHFVTANGGATGEVGWWFVWRNLMDSGYIAQANKVARQTLSPGANYANYPNNNNFGVQIKMTQQLLPYIRTSTVNYWNWHPKMITNGIDSAHIDHELYALGVQAWKNLTGKEVISNELASTSLNPNIIAEQIADASKVMKWVLLYDGESFVTNPTWAGNDVSFRNTNNSINAIGVNIRNVVQALKR